MRPSRLFCLAVVCMLSVQCLGPTVTMADVPDDRQGDEDEEVLLRVAVQQDIPNFNPFDLSSATSWKDVIITRWCFEGLAGLDPGGNIYPRLAESWTFDLKSLTLNVTLRDGVKFHDNHTMDVDDVVSSYKALRSWTTFSQTIVDSFDADGDGECSADEIDGTVDADGDGTYEGVSRLSATKVKIVMAQVNGRFFQETLGVPIIPEHIWEDHLTAQEVVDTLWNTDPAATIGTGPLHYDSGEADEWRLMRAFEDYWGTEMKTPSGHWTFPQEVDGVNFTLYSSQDVAVQDLKGGRLDLIPWSLDSSYMADLVMNPNTDVETIADNGFFYLAHNLKREPMNLMEFRQAVSHLIDKETIVQRYMGGYGQEGDSCLPPYWADWYNSSVKTYPFDLNLAKQALQSGGFTGMGTTLKMPDGRPVPPIVILVPPVDYDPIRVKAGEMIAKNLRTLGADAEARAVDFDTLVSKMNSFDYDMLMIGQSLPRDPISAVFDIFEPTGTSNLFGFWSDSVDNPWYGRLGGVSTRADAETQQLAERFHTLGELARGTFDRDAQIRYTKWAQGIIAEALPVDTMYYRVNLYPVSRRWTGWVPIKGELLNVYTLGAMASTTEPPPVGDLNILLNVPDKLPVDASVPGNVVVHDADGNPVASATVDLSGSGVDFSPSTGSTGNDGVFPFNVTGSSNGYATLEAEASWGGDLVQSAKVVQLVAADPPAAFLQVRPEELFLGPGDSTDLVLNVTDAEGVGISGFDVELDGNILGWGSMDVLEVTTNASGEATMTYTAPSELPLNEHMEVRLSLSPKARSGWTVNTVTQFLVLRNEDPSEWRFVTIENVTRFSCDGTHLATEVTLLTSDQDGDPVSDTVGITYSNGAVLDSPPDSVTTDGTGTAKVTLTWDSGIDTNATQVFFRSEVAINSVGAGACLLFNGSTPTDLYGGLTTLKGGGTPMMDPDAGGKLTWEVRVHGLDGAPADVPVSFVVGLPTEGSTVAMTGAPDYIWNSLWDYAPVNAWTGADTGYMTASGYFLSDLMSDAELRALPNNLFTSWEDVYDIWYGGTVDELEDMTAVQVTDGTWEVSVEGDQLVLSDNVPSLLVVPRGKAGFYSTPDFANYWWEIEGLTGWRTEYVVERTDHINSPTYEFDRGILDDFAPDDQTDVDIWVHDQDGDPVSGLGVDAYVTVYGGTPFFDTDVSGATDAQGRTTATVTALPRNGRGDPLVNPVKQPVYIGPGATDGWNVLASVELMAQPVQLYVDLRVTPVTSSAGLVHQLSVSARVFDEGGTNRSGMTVEFSTEGGAVLDTTDSGGWASYTLDVPDLAANSTFTTGWVSATVTEDGYGAASATHWFLSHTFGNEAPMISGLSIPDSGYETQNTTWDITGVATDDGVIDKLTASLDGGEPVTLELSEGQWTFHMEDLSVGEHSVTFTARDEWGLTASRTVTFTVLPPPNDPPVLSDISIPDSGYETQNTTWSITGRATDDWSIVSLTATLDGDQPVDLALSDGSWEFLMVDLPVGEHAVVFTVEDEWGLSVNRTVTFTVLPPPNEPPEIEEISIPDSGHETQDTSWSIVLQAVDDGVIAKVTASLDGGDPVELDLSGGDWSFAMTDLSVGEHTVVFQVVDAEGLSVERTVTFTILPPPNDPPVIESLSIPDSGHVTEDTSWSIVLIATDDWSIARVTGTLDSGDPAALTLADGQWTFEMEDLALGVHTVTFTAEDEWGLEASRTVTFEVIDLGPPSGTVTLDEGYNFTNETALQVTWQSVDDRSVPWVKYSLDQQMPDGDWEENDGSGVLEYTGPDGEVTVYLWFKDERDRVSAVATDTILVDTTPPVITMVKPGSHETTEGSVTFVFTVTDNLDISPFYRVKLTPDGHWEELTEPTIKRTIRSGGVIAVEISATDHAGNQARLVWRMERVEEASSPMAMWAVLILVVVAVAGTAVWMWTRRGEGRG